MEEVNLEQEIINFIAVVLKKEETKENPVMAATIAELYKALT